MKSIFKVLCTVIVPLSVVLGARGLELPLVSSELKTPAARADYVALHFWDAMDFRSPQATDADSMAQNFANFLSVFPVMSGDSARAEAIDAVVANARVTDDAAYMLSQTIENYLFAATSPMRDERLYTDFLRSMLAASYPDSTRSAWMLEMTSKNLPGSKVVDFDFVDRSGASHRLSEFAGTPVLLFFYDPECEDCHKAAAELADDFITRMRIEGGKLKVLAINPAEADTWRTIPQNFPQTWLDGCDNGVLDESGAFLFSSFPTFYLLDATGSVLLKEPQMPQLLSAISAL